MNSKGRRQKAEGNRQKAASSFAAYCLLLSAFYFPSHLSVSLSQTGRALLAAALLISAYALLRYWRSLVGRSNRVRFSLVTLRAVTLLLMSFALSGLEVEYETASRARVLLSSARVASSRAENSNIVASFEDKVEVQTVAALKGKGLEVALLEDESDKVADGNEGFVAAALLTDGAMRAEDARREVENVHARAGGAPVYVIANLNQEEGASVALENVTVLGRARLGVPVMIRCDVHARGMKGHESLVTIADDAKVQNSSRIAWTTDDERQSVTLSVVPKVAGWIDYSAKVEAVACGKDSSRLARPFSLYVEESKSHVLFFESEPTWEAKFIRRALEQSGLFDVDYFAQVSRAATTGMSEEAKEQGAGAAQKEEKSAAAGNAPEAKLHATLQNTARLDAYDCVIVGATDNSLLSSAEVAHLSDWVERRRVGRA